MKLSFNQVKESLDKKKPFPVYFLYGEEPYFIDVLVKRLEEELLNEEAKDFNQSILYGKDVDFKTVLDHAKRFPVFAERQVVVVREAQELKGIEGLEKYFENPVPSTVLVLAHKHKKPDGRKAYFKKISDKTAMPKVACFESETVKDSHLGDWIISALNRHKLTYEAEVPSLLSELLGNDLSKIDNELSKLALHNKPLNRSFLQEQVSQSKAFSSFELQDALSMRQSERVLFIAKQIEGNLKQNPLIGLIALLSQFFSRAWVVSKIGTQASDQDLAQALQLKGNPFAHKFILSNLKRTCKHYHSRELEQILHWLKIYDLRCKGVNVIQPGGEEGDATQHEALLLELMHLILQPLKTRGLSR